MNTNGSISGRSFVGALAAAAVTTVLVSALVEAFDPVQLQRLEDGSAGAQIAAAEARKGEALAGEV